MPEDKVFKDVDRLRTPERVEKVELARVVELCLLGKTPGKVLDVGTGSGLFAEAFAKAGLAVAGVDINEAMLAAARRYVPTGDFRQAPAEHLPFPDHSFDLVFIGMVLHEVNSPEQVLEEARRVCTNRVAVLEWPYRVQEFGPPLDHRLNPAEVTALAEKIGGREVTVTSLINLLLYRFEV